MRLVEGALLSKILSQATERQGPLRCIDINMGDWNRWGTIDETNEEKRGNKGNQKQVKKNP